MDFFDSLTTAVVETQEEEEGKDEAGRGAAVGASGGTWGAAAVEDRRGQKDAAGAEIVAATRIRDVVEIRTGARVAWAIGGQANELSAKAGSGKEGTTDTPLGRRHLLCNIDTPRLNTAPVESLRPLWRPSEKYISSIFLYPDENWDRGF
jgi:hypothetical protein